MMSTAVTTLPGLTYREIATVKRNNIFLRAFISEQDEDRQKPFVLAYQRNAQREKAGWFDINPTRTVLWLQHRLDNFTGYCGEDDALGDQIRWYTGKAYEMFAPEFIAEVGARQ